MMFCKCLCMLLPYALVDKGCRCKAEPLVLYMIALSRAVVRVWYRWMIAGLQEYAVSALCCI